MLLSRAYDMERKVKSCGDCGKHFRH